VQNGLLDGEIVIPAGRAAFTDIVIGLEVAGFPYLQKRFETRTQVTTWLFNGV
jgi:hypothetical protein